MSYASVSRYEGCQNLSYILHVGYQNIPCVIVGYQNVSYSAVIIWVKCLNLSCAGSQNIANIFCMWCQNVSCILYVGCQSIWHISVIYQNLSYTAVRVRSMRMRQSIENAPTQSRCLSAKEPLIAGLYCGTQLVALLRKWPTKIRASITCKMLLRQSIRCRVARMHTMPRDALSCRPPSAEEPLIIGLFRGKWLIKTRQIMHLGHPVHPTQHFMLSYRAFAKSCRAFGSQTAFEIAGWSKNASDSKFFAKGS